MRRRKKIYKPGEVFTIYVPKDIPKETLDWINSQREIGPTILTLISKVNNGQLIDVDNIGNFVDAVKILTNKANETRADSEVTSDIDTVLPLDDIQGEKISSPEAFVIEDENPFEDDKFS